MKFGFYKLFTVSPKVFVARPDKNLQEHLKALDEISQRTKDSAVVLFPELSISSYTAEDMLLNQGLLDGVKTAIEVLLKETVKHKNFLVAVGAPLEFNGRLYNTAVLMKNGKILGVVPKRHIPNYGEFYEYRYFTPSNGVEQEVELAGQKTLLSDKLIFELDKLKVGVDICEDIFAPIPPSSYATLAGANLILNLSASNELVGKPSYRKELLSNASARFNCGYLYASAGSMESSRDLIFGGHQLYYENGRLIQESERFNFDTSIMETEIDVEKLDFERRRNKTFGACEIPKMTFIKDKDFSQTLNLTRSIDPHPFVPKEKEKRVERALEVLELQAMGLARRLLALPKPHMVLGLSGGSDSTLALLVCLKACEKLNIPVTNIHALSMPGMGTSERTKNQSRALAAATGVTFKEISIKEGAQVHLDAISHEKIDVVYENAQARERMQTLFGYSNQVSGVVVGTSSLSEIWSNNATFGGDHLSGYGVSSSVPKTLNRYILQYYPASEELRKALDAVLATKISPELLPLDQQGNIAQSSEEMVGSYELHDFFMYYFLRSGFSKEKIEFLAEKAFKEKYPKEEISRVFAEGLRRFKQGQFKRTCSPPGVKVGSVTLSIREARFSDEME